VKPVNWAVIQINKLFHDSHLNDMHSEEDVYVSLFSLSRVRGRLNSVSEGRFEARSQNCGKRLCVSCPAVHMDQLCSLRVMRFDT
jgi:hypothetical protein